MSLSLPTVPKRYRGAWRRTLYAEPASEPYRVSDTTTRVIWLQGKHWHADIRLPSATPDFTGIESLDQCDRMRLEWLAGLTAFAGITQIEATLCQWHRLQELCPTLERDVGLLALDDDLLEERHPDARYVEHWQRIADGIAHERVRLDALGRLRWLEVGDHAVAIAARSNALAPTSLFEPIVHATNETLRLRASVRFDYLQRSAQQWKVVFSTHPWRAGSLIHSSTAPHPPSC